MILNRKKAPKIHSVTEIPLPLPELQYLDNGIPLYIINKGNIEAIRLEVILRTGRPQELKKTVARATASLLKEGTVSKNSAAIAEHFDFYGGSLSTSVGLDVTTVVMHSLTKYVTELLPTFAEILSAPVFPEKELATFVENSIQDLQVELTKNEVLAYRKLSESIFGATHPYGYNSETTDYKLLEINDIKTFYEKHFHANNATIIVSGKVTDETVALIRHHLGSLRTGVVHHYLHQAEATQPSKYFEEKNDSSQTAIAIGRKMFNRKHEDYNGMFVLNTILGGYFGSRLMENIREEKGYTYNIYSSLEPAFHDGYFYISTEVSNEFTTATLKEIYQELAILREELISEKELKMVRNYLLGNMLNLIDGPFNIAELCKTFIAEDIDFQDFKHFVNDIKTISPEQIRSLAQRYFREEDLWEVVIGKWS
jgi:zinc protease